MSERIVIGLAAEITAEQLKKVEVAGTSMVVARVGNGFCAVNNKCPHLGLPLAGGKVENGVVTCPFHNSRFDLCTGENLDWATGVVGIKLPKWSQKLVALGKPPTPVEAYEIIEEDGTLYVELE
jgi:nitrite reductase/ring-hydroxylating ferredoxin subunit